MSRSGVMKTIIAVIACLWPGVLGSKPLLLEEDCGTEIRMADRIMNGQAAKLGENPWMAYLTTPSGPNCSGTLINHWFVLTAAQCIPDDLEITVHLGEYNLDTKVDCEKHRCQKAVQEYAVDMAFKHAFYEPETHDNDIGMLRLDKRVTYLVHIKPICIFVDERMREQVDQLNTFTTTGWGETGEKKRSSVLQKMDISRQPKELCSEIFGKPLSSDQICGGNGNSTLCTGDIGSPQIREMRHKNHYRYVQVGLASWVSNQCLNASVLTDVLGHGHWIERVVRQFGPAQDMQRPSPFRPNDEVPEFYPVKNF
ncbi:serine protease grass [Drosophila biarmipes]|uniref:serine protease grass n=1 Tax=Drosophila biarmipes TaxID=125945 RepID=UPI0021CCBD63|nr:serine protease grass [Drosophila biarmipes]